MLLTHDSRLSAMTRAILMAVSHRKYIDPNCVHSMSCYLRMIRCACVNMWFGRSAKAVCLVVLLSLGRGSCTTFTTYYIRGWSSELSVTGANRSVFVNTLLISETPLKASARTVSTSGRSSDHFGVRPWMLQPLKRALVLKTRSETVCSVARGACDRLKLRVQKEVTTD